MTDRTSKQKSRDPEGRAINDKGIAFAEVLAAWRRGEAIDAIDVIDAQGWRIDNQSREIGRLRNQLLAARSPVETTQQHTPERDPADAAHQSAFSSDGCPSASNAAPHAAAPSAPTGHCGRATVTMPPEKASDPPSGPIVVRERFCSHCKHSDE